MEWSVQQRSFFSNSEHNINILSGSVSSGKTFISNLRFLRMIYEAPRGSLLVAIGRTTETLKDNVIDPIMKLDDNNLLTLSKNPLRIYCASNGVEVACCGGDNSSSWARIQGKTTSGALFDEATTLPKKLVQNIIKGCRFEGQTWPVIMTTNPDAPSHFIKLDYMDNTNLDVRTWEFRLPDNPSLSDEYINQVKSLYAGSEYDKMIDGKWTKAEGVVFNEFDRQTHTFGDKDIENVTFKEYVMGIDWGWTNPLALLYIGVDYDDNYYILDEFYKSKQHIDDSLRQQLDSKGWDRRKLSYCYADTNNPENILRMRNIGYNVLSAKKDVIEGISLTNAHFKNRRIKVHHRCINTIKELESYSWKMTSSGLSKDDPIKEDDHLCDALRYVIYTMNRGTVKLLTKRVF